MTFTIELEKMRFYARHGVFPQERAVGNWFEVSVSLTYEADADMAPDDNLAGTINYARVAEIVTHEMAYPRNCSRLWLCASAVPSLMPSPPLLLPSLPLLPPLRLLPWQLQFLPLPPTLRR